MFAPPAPGRRWTRALTRPSLDPADVAQAHGLADAVRLAVLSLPEPQRAIFLLSHYEGLSYAEIAEALDCPLGTVASRKHQATETLRRRLSPWRDTHDL